MNCELRVNFEIEPGASELKLIYIQYYRYPLQVNGTLGK